MGSRVSERMSCEEDQPSFSQALHISPQHHSTSLNSSTKIISNIISTEMTDLRLSHNVIYGGYLQRKPSFFGFSIAHSFTNPKLDYKGREERLGSLCLRT